MNKIKNIKILNFLFIPIAVVIFFTSSNLVNYKDIENWPVRGDYVITSEYGERISPITGLMSFHTGIDLGIAEDTELVSVIDSRVKFVGFYYGYGCTVVLENEDIEIWYSHISPDYLVHVGENILRGDVIGKGGPKYIKLNGEIITNGNTTGPHLHFEIKRNGSSIDPIIFLNSLEYLINTNSETETEIEN